MQSSDQHIFGVPSADVIEIRKADGSVPVDLNCAQSWEVLNPGENSEVTVDELMDEEHHRYYGRPWVLGQFYFDALKAFGLKSSDKVLDLGCGAGRLGIHLIPFLDEGGYCGIDYHLRSLVAFATYEAYLHKLNSKSPRLIWDADFSVASFGEYFDVVVDLYVTNHLAHDVIRDAFRKVAGQMRVGGRLLLAHEPTIGNAAMAEFGFRSAEKRNITYAMFSQSTKDLQVTDSWHVYEKL